MRKSYWAIIILAFLAAVASAFYYIRQPAWDLGPIVFQHKPKSPALLSSVNTSGTSSPGTVEGWTTYNNRKYGFSVSIPADDQISAVDLSDNRPNLPLMSTSFPESDASNQVIEDRGWYGKMNVTIFNSSKFITLKNYVNGNYPQKDYDVQFLSVNSQPVARVVYKKDTQQLPTAIFGNGKLFVEFKEAVVVKSNKIQPRPSIIDQLIPTFKFTN